MRDGGKKEETECLLPLTHIKWKVLEDEKWNEILISQQ
jgi:hypothetical protein